MATDLESWIAENPGVFARDVQIDDVAFRRLDPEYYAWLRSKMNLAKMAANTEHLDQASFYEMRRRFNAVHEWAMEHLGESALSEALRKLDARDYRPPVAEPAAPARRNGATNASSESNEIIATVDAISEQAMALGWRYERLYAIGKGVFDPNRGLICFLKLGDRIGEVTAQSIEILHPLPSDGRHRFYNPDVDQPWIIRTATKKSD